MTIAPPFQASDKKKKFIPFFRSKKITATPPIALKETREERGARRDDDHGSCG
jgi:hypothetical protein